MSNFHAVTHHDDKGDMTNQEYLMACLSAIQVELKVPKSLRNNFGNYNFRNEAQILETVKPLLFRYRLALVTSTELVEMGESYETHFDKKTQELHHVSLGKSVYIQATATLRYCDCEISVKGQAREPKIQKGMNDSQMSGSARSYAVKYALNNLFALDNSELDPDNEQYYRSNEKPKDNNGKSSEFKDKMRSLYKQAKTSMNLQPNEFNSWLEDAGYESVDTVPKDQQNKVLNAFKKDFNLILN